MSYNPHETFAEEAFRNPAKTASGFLPMNIGVCIYVDGFHVRGATNSMGQNVCPHKEVNDELGEIKEDGWTVQSAAKNERIQQLTAEVNNASKKDY